MPKEKRLRDVKLVTRYEKKYLLQGIEALNLLSKLAPSDRKNSYLVTSIYYDTLELDSYKECRDGDYHKIKYRLRNYNNDQKLNYWEVKTKKGHRSSKTRVLLDEIQNINELDILKIPIHLRSPQRLVKTVAIQYRRIVLEDSLNFRVTLDYDINFQGFLKNHKLRNLCVIEVKSDKLFDSTSISLPLGPFTLKAAHSKFSKYYHCMRYILGETKNAF